MINKFKKNACKITAVSLSATLLFGGLILSNHVNAKTNETQLEYVNDMNESQDENYKYYMSQVDKLAKDVDFKLMLPTYLPEDYKLELFTYNKDKSSVNLLYPKQTLMYI
ncbi:hypothetical protein SH1V18_00320 [Vallitalea longa]|uniref:Uncharacterized protein n=1 Tax=Vallitalea longa TaxID=2936439 RepID=A0A9W5Y7A7_9FIRM|nr:hypothetical protein [Vallitalea longa]GKX27552.1 hypothetical protein SH1V18_00320 [Vallitalea longa]